MTKHQIYIWMGKKVVLEIANNTMLKIVHWIPHEGESMVWCWCTLSWHLVTYRSITKTRDKMPL